MAGIFGNLFQDDPGYSAPQGGIMSGYGPLAGNQKAALLFAGLRDAVGSFSGAPQSNYMAQQGQDYYRQNAMNQRQAVNAKIKAAYASGDMNAVRQALVEASSTDPEAVGHILQALQFGAPQDVAYAPGQTVYSKEPLTGNLTEKFKIPEKPTPNQPFNPDGTPNKAYQDYQVMLRQQGRDAGLGADALFSMIDTGQGAFGVTRGGAVKPMMGPDGKPLISYHSDPQTRFDTSAAGAAGKAAGTAAEAWPATEANFGNIRDTLAKFDQPEFKGQAAHALGLASHLPNIPGYNTNFNALREQIRGQNFLAAFNQLRGGGAITEIEGMKAENAIGRLDKAQTTTEFYAALKDLRGVIDRSYASAKQRSARGAVIPALQGGGSQSAGGLADPLGLRK